MSMEIEYRYLISDEKFKEIKKNIIPKVIRQAYLIKEKAFHIRVRIEAPQNKPQDVKASITTKVGKKPAREEYENDLELSHAEVLFNNAISQLVKWRYALKDEHGQEWEVDYYPSHDLVVAELEVESLEYKVILPPWVIKEVTQEDKYSNTTLATPTKKAKS